MTCGRLHLVGNVAVVVALLLAFPATAQESDPQKLLAEADRLAWLRAWTKAEPLFAAAERAFAARGDERNAMYARVSALRGQLPRLPVPEVSERLAEYLENPLVQADDHLRLRCLVIKGETDEDLDPVLSEKSWREAMTVAERLGEHGWANRARGELGLVAFLQGNVGAAITQLGQALKVAEATGDTPSVVRWLTLFGHGYMQLGRAAEALDFYDRALKIASGVRELQFPVMTYLGKGDALTKLGRLNEAEQTLRQAIKVATEHGALGYQAELTMMLAAIAQARKQPAEAERLLSEAMGFARQAGGNRIVAQIALEHGRLLRGQRRFAEGAHVLEEGISVARTMQEQLLLPRLLTELAELRGAERRYGEAASLLEEASDLFEGFLATASSPWVQGRIVNGAKDVFLARIRLEGARGPDANRLFAIVEQARGRALLELLLATPAAEVPASAALKAGERRVAALQVKLFQTKSRAERARLLDQIFVAEEQLAPFATAFFDRTRRTGSRRPIALQDLQRALRRDELFVEFALADPGSYALVVTRTGARVQTIAGRTRIAEQLKPLIDRVRSGQRMGNEARAVAAMLIDSLHELARYKRVIVSPDAELHHVPFELLPDAAGRRMLDTHVVSYAPSGSVLTLLRERGSSALPSRPALAVSASPDGPAIPSSGSGASRGIYDLDVTQLRPLPAANDEAQAVGSLLGAANSTVLVGDAATEAAIKKQPLHEFRVVHFAVHGIPSTRFPARAALLVKPAERDDGLLQAREILMLRLRAGLVTLSACETSSGSIHEQEGVASLVRPFLAAGARSVVANVWAADDQFSLSLMREFYKELAVGVDVGESLRRAKLRMLELFGPDLAPKLWSGVLVYGDAAITIASGTRATH